jgi:hypothetical protein
MTNVRSLNETTWFWSEHSLTLVTSRFKRYSRRSAAGVMYGVGRKEFRKRRSLTSLSSWLSSLHNNLVKHEGLQDRCLSASLQERSRRNMEKGMLHTYTARQQVAVSKARTRKAISPVWLEESCFTSCKNRCTELACRRWFILFVSVIDVETKNWEHQSKKTKNVHTVERDEHRRRRTDEAATAAQNSSYSMPPMTRHLTSTAP